MRQIYLDYAATTPLDKRVLKAMKPFLKEKGMFGNPGSLHQHGQKALAAMDEARATIARCITAHPNEIIMTGSATEANNLIIRGTVKAFFRAQKTCSNIPEIIVSAVEHPAVLETVNDLEKDGSIKAHYIGVDSEGVVDVDALKEAINNNTILVSVMWVNNETGTIQPISTISEIVKNYKNTKYQSPKHKENKDSNKEEQSDHMYPLLHTDAVQAAAVMDINVRQLGVDALTLSAHKIYGPKGVGMMYCREEMLNNNGIAPMITGGGQESGMRSGTQNVAGIVGFAEALRLCVQAQKEEAKRLKELSEWLRNTIDRVVPKARWNGSVDRCAPHIINVTIPCSDTIGVALDGAGVGVSMGSACAQRRAKPSYVLKAMGVSDEAIRRSIRISMGRMTTRRDLIKATRAIEMACKKNKEDADPWCHDSSLTKK